MNEAQCFDSIPAFSVLANAGALRHIGAGTLHSGGGIWPDATLNMMARDSSLSTAGQTPVSDSRLETQSRIHPEVAAVIKRLGAKFVIDAIADEIGREALVALIPQAQRGRRVIDDTAHLNEMADRALASGRNAEPYGLARRIVLEWYPHLNDGEVSNWTKRIVPKFRKHKEKLILEARQRRRQRSAPVPNVFVSFFSRGERSNRFMAPATVKALTPFTGSVRLSYSDDQDEPQIRATGTAED